MLLLRTDTGMGIEEPSGSLTQPAGGREGLRIPGRSAEPFVHAQQIVAEIAVQEIEDFRPLLPVGYEATVVAYRKAMAQTCVADLTNHYKEGLHEFQSVFVPYLKRVLHELSGGVWDLGEYRAYAAGSDVDFMAHVIAAVTQDGLASVYPGDWFGFRVGASQPDRVRFTNDARSSMACLCVPSVRNGHLTEQMLDFLEAADSCLLNINLYPTLAVAERRQVAESLSPFLSKSVISISFSRGFALTASQLGVVLIHQDHPLRKKYETQWNWFSYFFNAIAARAFMNLDLAEIGAVDDKRRHWVLDELAARGLPVVDSGTYYVKSFQVEGQLPAEYSPLVRDGLLRLCFKPPKT